MAGIGNHRDELGGELIGSNLRRSGAADERLDPRDHRRRDTQQRHLDQIVDGSEEVTGRRRRESGLLGHRPKGNALDTPRRNHLHCCLAELVTAFSAARVVRATGHRDRGHSAEVSTSAPDHTMVDAAGEPN